MTTKENENENKIFIVKTVREKLHYVQVSVKQKLKHYTAQNFNNDEIKNENCKVPITKQHTNIHTIYMNDKQRDTHTHTITRKRPNQEQRKNDAGKIQPHKEFIAVVRKERFSETNSVQWMKVMCVCVVCG